MHLKQLKLAGFKSFVDPTVVHFPSQLVAVLGPNGCGKSNIIDAVRWVMGESSAKNLRGESMIDVIFNGSTHRKPLGQASVELIFDNSMGRLSGPYSSYREISVKRLVTRDGESTYYLNGARCRRRDITDLFLGTGAGTRGYSIIGQGTISRLIEAKPEELRAFLEEAAGVSKYKERRRETLQRIEHTRENLTRVLDIRDELDKQLQRLERQAKAAERYTVLKEEERGCRAEILALKWKEFHEQRMQNQQKLYELAMSHEHHNSLLTSVNSNRLILQEKLQEQNDKSQEIQSIFYQIGTEIARLEESIQQREREQKRLESDRAQIQSDCQIVQETISKDQEELTCRQQQTRSLEVRLSQLKEDFLQSEKVFKDAQNEKTLWESKWQEMQKIASSSQKELEVAQVKFNHLQHRRQQTQARLEKLMIERSSCSISDLYHAKKAIEEQKNQLKETQEQDAAQLKNNNEIVSQMRARLKETEQQFNHLQDEFLRVNTEHAGLVAAQKAALSGTCVDLNGLQEWSDLPRLMTVLQVTPKWQFACEMVLSETLNAFIVDDMNTLFSNLEWCSANGFHAVTFAEPQHISNDYPRLVQQIKGKWPVLATQLGNIIIAEHFEEAMQWLPNIHDNESILLANGVWFGKGWVKCASPRETDELGMLARQQRINELVVCIEETRQKIHQVKLERDHHSDQLQDYLNESDILQLNLNASNEALRDNQNALAAHDQAIQHAQKVLDALALECNELTQSLEESVKEQLSLEQQINQYALLVKDINTQQEQWSHNKLSWVSELESSQETLEATRLELHQVELEWNREMSKTHQLTERIHRDNERLMVLQDRLEQLTQLCLQPNESALNFKKQLNDHLLKHQEIELALIETREHIAETRLAIEEIEKQSVHYDLEVKKLQEIINQTRLDEQALAVRESAIQESLDEMGLSIQPLLEQIPEGVSQSKREEELISITEKIKRLGAINLAAIEEFAIEQQRKIYLDEQYNDLNLALSTLETAIEKMDKETRLRLENTFDEVNSSFKSLFPRLFGGGRAYLELTCDNLLEAGIVVMAQPPGKRNSTIHLLSGGEKAMTAVALVFAIFQLNPSPFCMLDEVDAPLDDVNVGRFCDLVKEMSQFVQFLFITHNKVTMQLADHLIGVTMREPGVSRLVSVDVTHALTME